MNVKTASPNHRPTGDRPRGTVGWFGDFDSQAIAADSNELASAIEDFLRDYPLARGHHQGIRYVLHMEPLGRRMHGVRLEPLGPDGATLEATIPVGRPVARRAPLTTIGWPLERASTGTRHYTRRFTASDAAPAEIVNAVDEANRALYGGRAKDIRWSLSVSPMYVDAQALHRWSFDVDGQPYVVRLGVWGAEKAGNRTFWSDGNRISLGGPVHIGPRVATFELGGREATMTMRIVAGSMRGAAARSLQGWRRTSWRQRLGILAAFVFGGPGVGGGVVAATAPSGALIWTIYTLRLGDEDMGSWVVKQENYERETWTFAPPGALLPDRDWELWPTQPA